MADVRDEKLAKLIGRNISNLLLKRGKNQKDLCDNLGFSPASVSSWVNGTRIPKEGNIILMAAYLDCSVDDIALDPKEAHRKRSFSIPFGWMLLVSIDFAFTPDGIFPLNEDSSLPFAYPIHKGDLSRMKAGPERQWSQSALHMRGIHQFSNTGFQPSTHFHLATCFHKERIQTSLSYPEQLIRLHV